jgi:hypothetical protein
MAIYEAYFNIEVDTDKDALNAIVITVAAVLTDATEGHWRGQVPAGSIAALRTVYDAAALVNELPLSTQAEINEHEGLLTAALAHFESLRSDIDRPWIDVHRHRAFRYGLGKSSKYNTAILCTSHESKLRGWFIKKPGYGNK